MKLPKTITELQRTFAAHATLVQSIDCIEESCRHFTQGHMPQGWTCTRHDPLDKRTPGGIVITAPFRGDRQQPGDLDLRLLSRPVRGTIQ